MRARLLRRALRAEAPDVVIAHSYLPGIYSRLVWGSRGPVHVVLHSASDDHASWASRVVERMLLRRTASVIAVSQRQLDQYRTHFPRGVMTVVIPNGVSKDFAPKNASSEQPRRVVTIARVTPQKRPMFWRSVVAHAATELPALKFEWWGPLTEAGDLAEELEGGLANALYMGSTDDVATLLRNADIVFHPADREAAASIALIEAAVSGTPIVYSDSLHAPDSHPYWSARYCVDSPEDAVRVLRATVDQWEARTEIARAYGGDMMATWSMASVARRYLQWIGTPPAGAVLNRL